jgi:hypothetical protein
VGIGREVRERTRAEGAEKNGADSDGECKLLIVEKKKNWHGK